MSKRWKNPFINLYRGTKSLWQEYHFLVPPKMWKKYITSLGKIVTNRGEKTFLSPLKDEDYHNWIRDSEKRTEHKKLKYRPLVSVLMLVEEDTNKRQLKFSIRSVLTQAYDNFEICVVGDGLTDGVKMVLKKYEKNEKVRVKHRKQVCGEVANDALEMAKGEFVVVMEGGDVLAKDALYEMVAALNKDKKLDFIYSDEDKIDARGRRSLPHFKPDFSPDTLLSLNYIGHVVMVRAELMREVGGFVAEEGRDYDLFLRLAESTNKIYHIPKVLYHQRKADDVKLDGKNFVCGENRGAVEKALARRGVKGKVEIDDVSGYNRVTYDLKKEPMVSVIVPTKDYVEITETCLRSVFEKTTYKNYEVIVANNRSEEEATFELFRKYKKKYKNFRVIDADMEFNYSRINNLAVKQAKGEVIMLLNNDTEVITPEWMTWMVGYAVQPHVGAVGAKLFYPDDTVQHAGVVLGLGGVAGHAYSGEDKDGIGVYGRLRVPYDYGAVTAACLCLEKKKYDEIGGLEEELKVAYNDVDLNMKLLKKGYYNVVLPMVELYHYESKSRGLDTTPEKEKRFKSEIRFMKTKWKKELMNDKYYNPNFTLEWGWFEMDRKKD